MTSASIRPLRPEDEAAWHSLARGYKAFYETALSRDAYAGTWQRLLAQDGIHGLGAEVDGRLVGIAHYLFHGSCWAPVVCYLQDLYVDPPYRGHGAARALIEAVADAARGRSAARLYWSTRESNAAARRLYNQVASHDGYIRYDYPLVAPTPNGAPVADMAGELCALERRRTRSLVDCDMEVAEALHAPEYQLVTPAGQCYDRAAYLGDIAAGRLRYTEWTCGEMAVRFSAAMAAVRYRARLVFDSGRAFDCWHTDVYERRGLAWQAVWSQATAGAPTRPA